MLSCGGGQAAAHRIATSTNIISSSHRQSPPAARQLPACSIPRLGVQATGRHSYGLVLLCTLWFCVPAGGLLAAAVNDRLLSCFAGKQPAGHPACQPGHTLIHHLGNKRRLSLLTAAAAATPASQSAPPGLRGLYPQLAAHGSGYLKVSELHTLYYEVYGNPNGIPAVVVHGGPGAGCWPNHARFFDPAHYRVILLDQRGCGRSTPYGCLAGNTTAELVGDLEQLRRALGVQQWVMLGGSWGVTLTLAYAQVG